VAPIAAVAAALNYSHATVSQQLSLLETEVGVRLLEPVGRRVRRRGAHPRFAHQCHPQSPREGRRGVAQSFETLTGILRVAAFQSVLLSALPGAIADLAELHPRLRVEVFQGEPESSLPQLLASGYDLVVAEEYPGRPVPWSADLDWEELSSDPLRLAVPPDFDRDAEMSDEDLIAYLAQHPWVSAAAGAASRDWLLTLCRGLGFEPDFRYSTDHLLVHCRFAQTGLAVAVLPDLVRVASLDHPPRRPPRTIRRAGRILTASRRDAAAHPTVYAFREALGSQLC